MTPSDQIKEIAMMLAPENPQDQTDAVWLVQRYITQTNGKISDLQKQVALLEAKLEDEGRQRSDAVNAKLAAYAEKEQAKLERDEAKGVARTAGVDDPLKKKTSDGEHQ